MSNFKISKRVVHSDSRSTIMEKDSSKIQEILEKEKKIPNLIKRLDRLNPESKEYNDINMEINRINKKEELEEYLFNLADFLIENREKDVSDEIKNSSINKFIHVEKKNNNSELYNNYVEKCLNGNKKNKGESLSICKSCKSETRRCEREGTMTCYNCGLMSYNPLSEKPEWNTFETTEYVKPFSYKRSNHFKEWLNQIQGCEGTNIPDKVIESIKIEIFKERINDKKLITYEKTKQFLKKLRLNKYYEHIPNIIHKITGNKQLVIDSSLECKLTQMFEAIQAPFQKYCPINRKNFLSYSYTLYKFFQILKLNEYLIYFPLLKSRDKLFEQENIWKNICKELKWEFIKCI